MENPVERIKNKLSPFLNLVAMLKNAENEIKPFNDEKLNLIINHDLSVCSEHANDIHRHLSEAQYILEEIKPETRYRYQQNHVLSNLPKTVANDLHYVDAAVAGFIQRLINVDEDNYLMVIDEMFMYYTKLSKHYQDELLHMQQRLTPQDIARLKK